ncbi:MAG: membrane-bound lytic murein transglycosylase D [Saprospiraceae bacterium]|mgnify:CR=1 FL=1|jgi:membrane-bound lytic murein transglycosylase D
MKPITLVLLLGLIFSIGSVQAQEFRFPSKVRVEGNKSYTYEALEAQEKRAENPRTVVNISDEMYKQRVEGLSGEIEMHFNSLIKSHVKAYVTRRRASTEKIISRSMVYFPIFEETFRRHNMPTDLKYLAIVESALNPRAVSPVGATGLWQFMKPTGKEYGLRINSQLDERRDPHAATDAAARYLSDLYNRYGDWNMAIAAYNCGPGRVNQAVKKSGDTDYWVASKFMPKETRNYVPAFIGVAYAMNYYHLHNIYPEHPEYDLQILDKIRVFDKVTFKQISEITGVTMEAIRFMNPAFNNSYIPANKKGYILSLPLTVMAEFRAAVPNTTLVAFGTPALITYEQQVTATPSTIVSTADPVTYQYEQTERIYDVKRGDNLGKIAKQNSCSVSNLREWNNIKGSLLQIGQQLVIKEKKIVDKFYSKGENGIGQATSPATTSKSLGSPATETKTQNLTFHKVKRGESLWSIAKKSKSNIQDIRIANNLKLNQKIEPGMRLVLPGR